MNLTHVTRTRSLSALALVTVLAAAPLAVSAAPGMFNGGGPCPYQMNSADAGRFGGAQGRSGMQGGSGMQGLRALNLSQDQQDRIFKIRNAQAQALYDGRKGVWAARDALQDIARADTYDESKARQAAEALGRAQSQMALLRAQAEAQIHAVLTLEQRQQLAAMQTFRRAGNRAGF